MKNKKSGFSRPVVLLIIVVLVVLGYYFWSKQSRLPDISPNTNNVSEVTNSAVGTVSPADSHPESLKIISPNGGEKWRIGETHEIKWNVGNWPTWDVDIFVVALSGRVVNFSRSIVTKEDKVPPSQGTFTWEIPEDFPVGENYQIRISSEYPGPGAGGYDFDDSDSSFSIVK